MESIVVDVLARPFHGEDGVARYPHLIFLPFACKGILLGRAIHRPSPTFCLSNGHDESREEALLNTVPTVGCSLYKLFKYLYYIFCAGCPNHH